MAFIIVKRRVPTMSSSAFQMGMSEAWTERQLKANPKGNSFPTRYEAEDYLKEFWEECSFGAVKPNEGTASYEPRIAKQKKAFDGMFKIVNLNPRRSRRKPRP